MSIKMKMPILLAVTLTSSFGSIAQVVNSGFEAEANAFHKSKKEALVAAGLDIFATKKNNRILEVAAKNIEGIKSVAGEKFGGTWIEYDENNEAHQVVSVTEPISFNSKSTAFPENGLTIVNVKYSYADLEKLREKVFGYFLEISKDGESQLLGIAIDDQNNRLLVRGRAADVEFITNSIKSIGFDMNAISVEQQDGPVNFMGTVFGGTKIVSSPSANGPVFLCTTGFNVVIDVVYPGSITAAHCYENNKTWKNVYFNLGGSPTGSYKGDYIGEYLANGWVDNMDAVIFGNTNFVHTLYPKIITTPNNVISVKEPLHNPNFRQIRACNLLI